MTEENTTDTQLNNARLLSIVERIEHVNAEIADLTEDKKGIVLEAKGAGFDPKAIAHVIKKRKMDKAKRDEEENLFAIYEHAVGLE